MISKTCVASAGRAYVAWQLSRRGWNVRPCAIGSSRSTGVEIQKGVGDSLFRVQSRAFSSKNAVRLGVDITNPDALAFDWMIITTNVMSSEPISFLLNSLEVFELRKKDPGGPLYWLDPPRYLKDVFRERWDDLG